ncbi:hypothetical protein MATL_G00027770 [Megalops atlanticus]|uniref:Uncharacterized protein n=1 Tax=Megalops atlanticus TaxID=7932 RepID=A0A9D3QI13_MEGAT|nr:hypothetical protein MATL_G00027770 [Megalops atlanticus]
MLFGVVWCRHRLGNSRLAGEQSGCGFGYSFFVLFFCFILQSGFIICGHVLPKLTGMHSLLLLLFSHSVKKDKVSVRGM